MKQKAPLIFSIFATVAVMGVIFWFSSQPGVVSHEESRAFARWLASLLKIEEPAAFVEHTNYFLRKLAHFSLYFALGLCMTGAAVRQKRFMPVLLVIVIGTLFAASDELHQCFSQGRTPGLTDVLLDVCGVAAGTLPLLYKRKR